MACDNCGDNECGCEITVATGADGAPGSQFLCGTVVPANNLGVDGDVFLDTVTNFFYKRVGGVWVFKTVLGTDGVDGLDGNDGNDGTSDNLYVRFAADNIGTGFSTVPGPGLEFIGFLVKDSALAVPVQAEFNGLWIDYVGDDGVNGNNGNNGTNGTSQALYIRYASDANGSGFNASPAPALTFIAFLSQDAALPAPAVGDFAGLWVEYVGADGSAGASQPVAYLFSAQKAGEQKLGDISQAFTHYLTYKDDNSSDEFFDRGDNWAGSVYKHPVGAGAESLRFIAYDNKLRNDSGAFAIGANDLELHIEKNGNSEVSLPFAAIGVGATAEIQYLELGLVNVVGGDEIKVSVRVVGLTANHAPGDLIHVSGKLANFDVSN